MKRRGLFGFLAAAPIAVVTGANAAAQKKPEPDCDKPLFKECNIIMNGGFSFRHGTPLKGWTKNPLLATEVIQVPTQTDMKNHGSIIMHEGELFIRSEHGDWRKIS